AVTSAERMPQLPNVPTFAELNYPEINMQTFYTSVAPRDTPAPILERLEAAYAEAGRTQEVKDVIAQMALLSVDKPRAELEKIVREARERWKKVILENDIKVE